ncbi:hypothetical protein LMIY3S_03720 [Labrys miyagiensis]
MDSVAVQLTLSAAQVLIPVIANVIENATDNATVKLAVDTVVKWTPIIVGAFPQLAAQFGNFISILRGNGMISDDDLAALDTAQQFLEAQRKAANDAAAAAGE